MNNNDINGINRAQAERARAQADRVRAQADRARAQADRAGDQADYIDANHGASPEGPSGSLELHTNKHLPSPKDYRSYNGSYEIPGEEVKKIIEVVRLQDFELAKELKSNAKKFRHRRTGLKPFSGMGGMDILLSRRFETVDTRSGSFTASQIRAMFVASLVDLSANDRFAFPADARSLVKFWLRSGDLVEEIVQMQLGLRNQEIYGRTGLPAVYLTAPLIANRARDHVFDKSL